MKPVIQDYYQYGNVSEVGEPLNFERSKACSLGTRYLLGFYVSTPQLTVVLYRPEDVLLLQVEQRSGTVSAFEFGRLWIHRSILSPAEQTTDCSKICINIEAGECVTRFRRKSSRREFSLKMRGKRILLLQYEIRESVFDPTMDLIDEHGEDFWMWLDYVIRNKDVSSQLFL
ncbi:hypothetical protein [Gimesia sp.]|uniref:hypothetical protein n=1 Tax=Gimesia sp. TaxID=2024833 RepID=UPI000C5CF6B3|nr:hypothetical protein [Gimesia sp.]MAX34941.1 hypothetical protein [Gimesia sp.]HAH43660.1 hypothetical protein [Planctomycetaceae bacterium]|tara:strand:- start:1548 stop:2063 length:516 start_codon:yes stop_codon:yes gene_type:complete